MITLHTHPTHTHTHSEFGEIDTDKVKAAVKTFTHSCAGYSVATYVLVSMDVGGHMI